jgi:hypothetical protein
MRWLIGVLVVIVAALTLRSGLVVFGGVAFAVVLGASRLLTREGLGNIVAERSLDEEEIEIGQKVCDLRVHSVCARNALERNAYSAAFHFGGELSQPALVNRKYIVRDPSIESEIDWGKTNRPMSSSSLELTPRGMA